MSGSQAAGAPSGHQAGFTVADSVQRGSANSSLQRPGNELTDPRRRVGVVREGSTRGGASGAPLVPILAARCGLGSVGEGATALSPVFRQGSGDAAVRIP